MFDHYSESQKRRRVASPALLAVATFVMVGFSAATIWGVMWLMAYLGFKTAIDPIEIFYDPYEDGTTLEDLAEGEVPPQLTDPVEVDSLPETAAPAPPAPETATPPK